MSYYWIYKSTTYISAFWCVCHVKNKDGWGSKHPDSRKQNADIEKDICHVDFSDTVLRQYVTNSIRLFSCGHPENSIILPVGPTFDEVVSSVLFILVPLLTFMGSHGVWLTAKHPEKAKVSY